jgi:hypothetical protein
LNARGKTAEGDIGISPFDPTRRNPGISNASIIPLAHADEVLHPQVERDGWPINSADAKRYRKRAKSTDDQEAVQTATPRRPVVVNQGRHPRNVQIIPKSRDFH